MAGPAPGADAIADARRVDVAVEDTPVGRWQELIDLNLTSALVCCQKLCRGMLERGRGAVAEWYEPLAIWRDWADDVRGHALDCGHFLPEEAPREVATELAAFFSR